MKRLQLRLFSNRIASAPLAWILLILFILPFSSFSQSFSLSQFPAPLQFFPRDDQDSAVVPIKGWVLVTGYDSAFVRVLKDNQPYKREAMALVYSGSSAPFSFAPKIHAELSEYSFELYVKNSFGTSLLARRDSIVCGDVFLINGQSNSWPRRPQANYQNEFCRSFGRSTGYNPYNPADTVWGLARANGSLWFHTGAWGIKLQQLIKETYGVPVCIINGGSGGSSIEYNLPNDADRMNLNTTYGRLLYRATKAGVADHVKALFWHQGESNSNATWVNYKSNFEKLLQAWRQDYLSIRKWYVFQIRPGCGGANQSELREVQRNFYSVNIEIMSTTALPGHDGCHYTAAGYFRMAEQLFRQVARDFYGAADTVNINPPDIATAYYSTTSQDEIVLEFSRTDSLIWPVDYKGHRMVDYFYLDGTWGQVISGRAEGNKVILKLAGSSTATTITYLPGRTYNNSSAVYEGPWITNTRGIGALSFHEFPIALPPAGPPELLEPVNGAQDLAVNVHFTWRPVERATSYHIQVSESPSFTSLVIDASLLQTTEYRAQALVHDRGYYWRVQAVNDVTSSKWSEIRSFTTIMAAPEAPVLVAPVHNAAHLPPAVTLQWDSSSRAETYQVQVARDAGFQHLAIDASNFNATSYDVHGLDFETTFFWRVRARNKGGFGPWSERWMFTTAIEPPGYLVLISPANGDVDLKTTVAFQWHPAPRAARYRLVVARDSTFGDVIVRDSTITDSTYVPPEFAHDRWYYWRVQALNPGGTGPWSPTWRFKTVVQRPATPRLSAPKNMSVHHPRVVGLVWHGTPRAAYYDFQLSRDSLFHDVVMDRTGVFDTIALTNSLVNGKRYFWRVRAVNAGGVSDWSETWSFTVVPQVPAPVTLVRPADGAAKVSMPVALEWRSAARAEYYSVQIAGDPTFKTIVATDSAATDTSWTPSSMFPETQYFWRVRARNAGGVSDWSATWSFRTALLPPAAPRLVFPADGSRNRPLLVRLRWEQSGERVTYRYQLARDGQFADVVSDGTTRQTVSPILGPLAYDARYHWRVKAENEAGSSGWSSVWSFTTAPPVPPAPVLLSPAQGTTGVPIPARLKWESAPGAGWYRIQVSAGPVFDTPLIDEDSLASSTYVADGLSRKTTYFWRVKAVSTYGASSWSPAWSFTTVDVPPPSPSLLSPPDNSENVAVRPVLSWHTVPGASRYQVQLAREKNFDSPVLDADNLASTSYPVAALGPDTWYFWRVRAFNDGGAGPWSAVWRFFTGSLTAVGAPPSKPTEVIVERNYPNPFGPASSNPAPLTNISFVLSRPAEVSVSIFSTSGEKMATVVSRSFSAGRHVFAWRPMNLPGGMYLVRFESGAFAVTRKILYLK